MYNADCSHARKIRVTNAILDATRLVQLAATAPRLCALDVISEEPFVRRLPAFAQLRELRLTVHASNQARHVDLTPLATLTHLETLWLVGSEDVPPPVDLAPLSQLTSLRHLTLRYWQATELAPLRMLIQLRTLDLQHTGAHDWTFAAPASVTWRRWLRRCPTCDDCSSRTSWTVGRSPRRSPPCSSWATPAMALSTFIATKTDPTAWILWCRWSQRSVQRTACDGPFLSLEVLHSEF